MTNRRGKLVVGIWAAFVALGVFFPSFAKTPLPTQFIAPVTAPTWENAVQKTGYGKDEGFEFTRVDTPDWLGGYNYFRKIGQVSYYAYDRGITKDNFGRLPASKIVRSVTTVLKNGRPAPALRYLYNANVATKDKRLSPAAPTDISDYSQPEIIESLAIINGIDATAYGEAEDPYRYTPYVQGVHTDWVYTVTFKPNGGSGTMPNQTLTNSAALVANTFTKAGHTFDGWATSAGGAKAYGDKATVSRDLTLYARWKANGYAVTFTAGTGVERMYYRIGSGGWTEYAEPFQASSGSTVSGYAVPKVGYTAANPQSSPWSATVVAQDLSHTFTATANTYAIAFNPVGGCVTPTTLGVTYGENYPNLPTPTHTNTFSTAGYITSYTFAGWYTAQSGGDQRASSDTYTTVGNQTLYAHWSTQNTAKRYQLLFDGNGATAGSMSSVSVSYGTETDLPVCGYSRTGHDFVGWSKSTGETARYTDGATITVNDDYIKFSAYADRETVTLYAKWTSRQCSVSFDANGGSPSSSKNVAFGGTYGTLPGNCTRTGYTFAGWWTASSGGTQVMSTTTVTNPDDHTLYAHWTAVPYDITYTGLKPGATHANPATYTIEDAVTFASPTAVAGYRFTGWDPPSIVKGSTGAKTVKAQYLKTVARPTLKSLTYNGSEQIGAVSATGYSASGKVRETVPGTYAVTFKLTDGYCWSDGSQTDYSVDWKILNASIADVSVRQAESLAYTGEPQTAQLTQTATTQGGEAANWTYSTSPDGAFSGTVPAFADIGAHTVYYKVEAKYHNSASGSFQIVIGAGLTLRGNGGTIDGLSETNISCALGESYPSLPVAERDGFAFAGWWTASDFTNGVQKTTNDLVTVEALTLYARWKEPSHAATRTVTLNSGAKGSFNGASQTNLTRTVGAAIGDIPAPIPHNADQHLFYGWYDEGGSAVTRDTVVLSNMTLLARWSEKRFNDVFGDTLCFDETNDDPWLVGEGGAVRSAKLSKLEEATSKLLISASSRGQFNLHLNGHGMRDNWTKAEWCGWDWRIGLPSDSEEFENYIWGNGLDWSTNLNLSAVGVCIRSHKFEWAKYDDDYVCLASLTWTPDPVVSPIDAWDSAMALSQAPTNAVFETGGSADWEIVTNATEFAEGVNGIASVTNPKHGRSTWTRMTVNGPGCLSFAWKVSSEKGYVGADGRYVKCDYLEFCDGETPVAFVDGQTDFATVAYAVESAGSHSFVWRYVKDGTGSAGADRGFVDAVTWSPVPPAGDGSYTICFKVPDGLERPGDMNCTTGRVYRLPDLQPGFKWRRMDEKARLYDGGMLVFDLTDRAFLWMEAVPTP